MDSGGDSPTGIYGSRPADILHDRYRRGNRESVRQLSLRVRLAEERSNKLRNEREELKIQKEKLAQELDEKKKALASLRDEFQERIGTLEKQLHEAKFQGTSTRVKELMSLFDASFDKKSYEPPYPVAEKSYLDVSVGTDSEAGCSEEVSGKSSQDQAVVTDMDVEITSSNDFEERTKLEADKFFLETQLKLARNKIGYYGLQEVQKKNLEKRNIALSEMVDKLIAENETLKNMAARSVDDGSEGKAASRKLIDITLEYEAKLNGHKAELELKTKQLEELARIHSSALTNLETLKEKYKAMEQKISSAEIPQEGDHQLSDLNSALKKYMEENEKLKEQLAKYEKTSVSDTTMVLHYRKNPLDLAHQEYKEFETNRKRKAEVSLLCDSDDLDATVRKKQRDELIKQVSDLQFQLHKSEKEKERGIKIQSDLVKQYRAIVTTLSGWQIKMKDDGFAEVENVLNPGNFFVFKVENLGKSVSLLESDYAKEWPDQIQEYLEGRDSVPAFLAAVTLALDEQSQSRQYSVTLSNSS